MLIFSLVSHGGGRLDRSGMDGDDLLNTMTWLILTWLTSQKLLHSTLRKTGTRSSRKQSKFYCMFTLIIIPLYLSFLSLSLSLSPIPIESILLKGTHKLIKLMQMATLMNLSSMIPSGLVQLIKSPSSQPHVVKKNKEGRSVRPRSHRWFGL